MNAKLMFSKSKKWSAQQASVDRPVSLCMELIRTLQLFDFENMDMQEPGVPAVDADPM